jgi:hypothetical protein
LQKSLHLYHPKKNYFLKFPSLLKFLKPLPTADTNSPIRNSTITAKLTADKDFTTSTDRRPAYNSGFRFITLREFGTKLEFENRVNELTKDLKKGNWTIFKQEAEYCIYDNNSFLDTGWLPQ